MMQIFLSLILIQNVLTMESGLYLKLSGCDIENTVTVGQTLNVTYTILMKRGGIGFIGVTNPQLVFKVKGVEHLNTVPDRINIDIEDQEGCDAAQSGDHKTDEVVANVTIRYAWKIF